LWVPTAGYFGVRPTALIAMALSFVTCIWSASTQSFRSLEAARVICSIAASCGEVLPALIVKDIFFLHERGRVMGFYLIFFQSMPSLGILTAGFVIAGAGWRWWLWVLSSPVFTGFYN
jgi:MFS family permease